YHGYRHFLHYLHASCSFFLVPFFFYSYRAPRDLHSFPTRRSSDLAGLEHHRRRSIAEQHRDIAIAPVHERRDQLGADDKCVPHRSEEHTSELQSLRHLVCRLLLEKKKKRTHINNTDNTGKLDTRQP